MGESLIARMDLEQRLRIAIREHCPIAISGEIEPVSDAVYRGKKVFLRTDHCNLFAQIFDVTVDGAVADMQ